MDKHKKLSTIWQIYQRIAQIMMFINITEQFIQLFENMLLYCSQWSNISVGNELKRSGNRNYFS